MYAREDTEVLLDLNRPYYGKPCKKNSICEMQFLDHVRLKRDDKGKGKTGIVEGINQL